MKSKILISGSLAYDFIDKNKTVFFGGCAGNIAYNGRLIKEDFILFGIGGSNFGKYKKWLKKNKINTSHIITEKRALTSEARMTTLKNTRQKAVFHPHAAAFSKFHAKNIQNKVASLAHSITFALISPNDREFMMETIAACQKNRIPYFFDPGQAVLLFSRKELRNIIGQSSGLFLNEFEANFLKKILKIPHAELKKLVPLLIITKGASGSSIFWKNRASSPGLKAWGFRSTTSPLDKRGSGFASPSDTKGRGASPSKAGRARGGNLGFPQNKEIRIPSKRVKNPVDPTGCGDAYRAGFLTAIKSHYPRFSISILKQAGKLGTRLALACLQKRGTQNHTL